MVNSLPADPFAFPRRWRPVAPVAGHLLGIERCRQIYAGLPADLEGPEFIRRLLEQLGLEADCTAEDRQRIPATGGLLIVANHPFGAAEGLLLADLVQRIRPDLRILANHILGRFPQLQDLLIPVDPYGGREATRRNRGPLRRALRHLQQGGALIVFPAGDVSRLQLGGAGISDPPWSLDLAPLVRLSGAAVLPVWFDGGNGPLFQVAGLFHPRLRTALLPRQLLNKRRKALPLRIGRVLSRERLAAIDKPEDLVAFLRLRTYLLGRRGDGQGGRQPAAAERQPLAAVQPAACLAREVALLGPRQRLAAAGNLEVYRAEARQIPYLLLELGRLREMTFRGVDEGTGRPFDLDEFDNHYTHLFAWNRAKREVVGAYRLGRVDPGTEGFPGRLYTSTLFAYGADFLRRLGPALELGRSFVRPEYQRQFAPLLLLWKGIGAFVAENPRYRTLFGPVSITREYSRLSRELLTTALAENCLLPDLARLVRPRTPVRRRPLSAPGCDPRMLRSLGADLDAATELIAEIDPASGGMPVLLRHYLGLGGRVVAFNLDRAFSDVIDALVVVDLRQTDPRVLARYLGRRKADEFLRYHTPSASGLPACA